MVVRNETEGQRMCSTEVLPKGDSEEEEYICVRAALAGARARDLRTLSGPAIGEMGELLR